MRRVMVLAVIMALGTGTIVAVVDPWAARWTRSETSGSAPIISGQSPSEGTPTLTLVQQIEATQAAESGATRTTESVSATGTAVAAATRTVAAATRNAEATVVAADLTAAIGSVLRSVEAERLYNVVRGGALDTVRLPIARATWRDFPDSPSIPLVSEPGANSLGGVYEVTANILPDYEIATDEPVEAVSILIYADSDQAMKASTGDWPDDYSDFWPVDLDGYEGVFGFYNYAGGTNLLGETFYSGQAQLRLVVANVIILASLDYSEVRGQIDTYGMCMELTTEMLRLIGQQLEGANLIPAATPVA